MTYMLTHRIHKLSPLIISQIAAGEVIDRPASVVKELVENAIDAGSKRIVVQTWQGGMSRIDVTDDGMGIHEHDIALSMMRHTTSKLATDDVLSGVHTLGFRGEALASIAAVARIKLASSADDTGIGHELCAEGEALESEACSSKNPQLTQQQEKSARLKPVAMSRGTHVSVQALFFNVPARRRFLKSIATEFGHIETIIRRLALNYFDISFELWHDDQLRLSVNAIDEQQTVTKTMAQQKRLAILLDNKFAEKAQSISVNFADGMSDDVQAELTGWLSTQLTPPPDLNNARAKKHSQKKPKKKTSATYQFWFVNGRLVQNRVLKNLVQQSIEQAIQQYCAQSDLVEQVALAPEQANTNITHVDETFCMATLSDILLDYVLFLRVPDDTVNVNIHPTKLDVRLENEQQIATLVGYFLQKQLRSMLTVSAPSVLVTAHEKQQTKIYSDYGKAVFWNNEQLLSQTNDGFLLVQATHGLGVNSETDAQQLLETWQKLGQPQDVTITNVSYDKLVDWLAKQ